MPLPTDKVQHVRTFRQCAKEMVGICYHAQSWALGDGAAVFQIYRGHESLVCALSFPTRASRAEAVLRGPVFHGGISKRADHPFAFMWEYDCFGDFPFSGLKSGGYRPNEAKEWGTVEVFEDSIDEVRRVLGIVVPIERPPLAKVPGMGRQVVRRILIP